MNYRLIPEHFPPIPLPRCWVTPVKVVPWNLLYFSSWSAGGFWVIEVKVETSTKKLSGAVNCSPADSCTHKVLGKGSLDQHELCESLDVLTDYITVHVRSFTLSLQNPTLTLIPRVFPPPRVAVQTRVCSELFCWADADAGVIVLEFNQGLPLLQPP